MANDIAPGFVKVLYTILSRAHRMVIPVQCYQGIGGAWFISEKNDSVGSGWLAGVQALMDVVNPFWKTADLALQGAELWSKPTPSDDPVFVDSGVITNSATNNAITQDYSETVMTFRTQDGGVARLYMMETSLTANLVRSYPSYGGSTIAQDLAAYVIGDGSIVSGRDNSFCSIGLRMLTKTNDKLRKKYLTP